MANDEHGTPLEVVMESLTTEDSDEEAPEPDHKQYLRALRKLPTVWRAIDLEKAQEPHSYPSTRRMKIGFTVLIVFVPPLAHLEQKLHIPPPRRHSDD